MLAHKGTQEIRTARLLLRKYRTGDALDMFNNYATDERVTKFLSWEPYQDLQSVEKFVETMISGYTDDRYIWVIEHCGSVIGSISVVQADNKNEHCEIGYCLSYDFWNMGIVTEALSAVMDFLFHEIGYHRIFAKHDAENPASGKVMEKCGMIYEGRLRGHYLRPDGKPSDSLIYGALISDFNTTRK